jgi:hypothetical protein
MEGNTKLKKESDKCETEFYRVENNSNGRCHPHQNPGNSSRTRSSTSTAIQSEPERTVASVVLAEVTGCHEY